MNDLSNVSLWVDEVKKCKGGGQGMFFLGNGKVTVQEEMLSDFKVHLT